MDWKHCSACGCFHPLSRFYAGQAWCKEQQMAYNARYLRERRRADPAFRLRLKVRRVERLKEREMGA